MKKLVVLLVLVAGGIVAAAVPAFSGSSGAVNATVSVAGTCVTALPATVSFGVLPFSSSPGAPSYGQQTVTVANCSSGSESYLAKGTNAQGSTTTWSLAQPSDTHIAPNPCSLTPNTNQYQAGLGAATLFPDFTFLGTVNSAMNGSWASATAGEIKNGMAEVIMPCQGSGGSGETMAFTLTITAVP